MPVRSLGRGCYRWGAHGKRYCGPGARQKAEKQGRAAYSHGYKGHAKEMTMSLAADKKRWDELHTALAKATEAKDEFDRQLHAHYGRYEDQWLTKTQRAKLTALRAKEDKIGEKIFELVTRVSPRDWSYGVPVWWVRRELTWEDAVRPKNEPLSVVVPGSWGSPDGTVKERRDSMPSKTREDVPNAEAAGEQYAYDQIQGDYFMDWVREQLLEASKMPPDKVLPLETKDDALVIAKNMLRQLEQDTKRGLESRDLIDLIGAGSEARRGDTEVRPALFAEFYDGFRKACEVSRDWLADELLEIESEMRDPQVSEARRTSNGRQAPPDLTAHGLGSMQRLVLEAVRDHGEFYPPGSDYETSERMKSVGRRLLHRGLIGLRSHTHPELVAGRAKQLYLTDAGREALEKSLAKRGIVHPKTKGHHLKKNRM